MHILWEKLKYAQLDEEQKASLVSTPLGVFHTTDVANQFNLWIGHTDFKLTVGFLKGVRSIIGIETFNNITPIRFVVAIGKLFDENQVKIDVENLVKEDELLEVKKKLEKYEDWAIYQFPNGQLEITHSGKNNFKNRVKELTELKTDIGGRLITRFGV